MDRGRKLICPNCEVERDPIDSSQLKRLNVVEKYAHELNPVYVCVRHSGGCGHVFSMGMPDIIGAYLSGQLVWKQDTNDDKEDEVTQS